MSRFDQPDTYKEKHYIPMTDEEFDRILKAMECPLNQTEIWTKKLDVVLKNIQENINTKFTQKTEHLKNPIDRKEKIIPKLVNDDCTISMNAFQICECGPFSREEMQPDKNKIIELEEYWSNGKGAKNFREEKSKNHGELWEKALTVIFHKILGLKILVVRASKYDDLINGIDTYLVDENGNIICALDEVSTERGSELEKIKSQKVEDKNKSGGAKIKYGLSLDKERNIVKKSIENIPMFYMRLSGERLVQLLKEMCNNSNKDSILDIEFAIFNDLIFSLERQINEEKDNKSISSELREKMEQLLNSIENMKRIKNEKYLQNHKE